jgi:hypothetical protein
MKFMWINCKLGIDNMQNLLNSLRISYIVNFVFNKFQSNGSFADILQTLAINFCVQKVLSGTIY